MASHGITLKTIRKLALGSTIWDGVVPGFCARRQKSDVITYSLKYRTAEGRQRWHKIGRDGAPWNPELARAEALRLLGLITGATTAGVKTDPAVAGKTHARPRPSPSCATSISLPSSPASC
jgi:hypothetical protein